MVMSFFKIESPGEVEIFFSRRGSKRRERMNFKLTFRGKESS